MELYDGLAVATVELTCEDPHTDVQSVEVLVGRSPGTRDTFASERTITWDGNRTPELMSVLTMFFGTNGIRYYVTAFAGNWAYASRRIDIGSYVYLNQPPRTQPSRFHPGYVLGIPRPFWNVPDALSVVMDSAFFDPWAELDGGRRVCDDDGTVIQGCPSYNWQCAVVHLATADAARLQGSSTAPHARPSQSLVCVSCLTVCLLCTQVLWRSSTPLRFRTVC